MNDGDQLIFEQLLDVVSRGGVKITDQRGVRTSALVLWLDELHGALQGMSERDYAQLLVRFERWKRKQ